MSETLIYFILGLLIIIGMYYIPIDQTEFINN